MVAAVKKETRLSIEVLASAVGVAVLETQVFSSSVAAKKLHRASSSRLNAPPVCLTWVKCSRAHQDRNLAWWKNMLEPTVYLYDGPNVIEAVDQSANIVARYTQELRIDQPMAQLVGGANGYYHTDGLGSITSLSSSAGGVIETYGFDSVGNPLTLTGNVPNPFRYTGREFDSETGVYYYRARFYDPYSGRFLSEDPAEFLGGLNFYAYAGNHANNLVDPSGLAPAWWSNLVNWLNPPAPQPLYFPPPPAPSIPLKCQFSGQCDFTPDMGAGLNCFQECLGKRPTITCGRGGHAPTDPHSRGDGADYGTNNNPWLSRDAVTPCFTKCFPNSYCQEEYNSGDSGATHWHMQFNPSRRGNVGCSPYIHPHGQ